MTNHDRQQSGDEPEIHALIQAVRAQDFQRAIMTGVIKESPERSRKDWLRCATEIIEEYTERLRREDIRDLLTRVQSGDVELVVAEEGDE